jgi:hypothetical protein
MQKIGYFVVGLFIAVLVASAILFYKDSNCGVRYHSTILPQPEWLKNTTFEIDGYNITVVYIEGGNPTTFTKNGSAVTSLNPLDDVTITVIYGGKTQSVSYSDYAGEAPLFSSSFFHNSVILSTNQNSVNAIASQNASLNVTVGYTTCK